MVIGFAVGFSLSHGYKFQLFYCYCVQVAPECTVGLFRIQANAWHNCALTRVLFIFLLGKFIPQQCSKHCSHAMLISCSNTRITSPGISLARFLVSVSPLRVTSPSSTKYLACPPVYPMPVAFNKAMSSM